MLEFPKDFLNRVLCGDCGKILARLPDDAIDLTVTSPPYDKLRDYQGFSFNFEQIARELSRVTKKGGVIVWVVGDATINGSETGSSFRQALYFKSLGLFLHDTMIYRKSAFANPSRNRYHQIFEYMFIFSKGKPKTFNPLIDRKNKTEYDFSKKRRQKNGEMTHQDDKSRIRLNEYGMRMNIWTYSTGKGNSTRDPEAFNHPAIFPEKLAQDHILSWSNPGDVVLDPMCGSGTTLKMAALNGRNYIGIDLSEEYCAISRRRLNRLD